MKCFYLAMCFIVAYVGLCEAQEQAVNLPNSRDKFYIDYELSAGRGVAKDCDSGNKWRSGHSGGLGVNFNYSPLEAIRLRVGLSEQAYNSNRIVVHPYPYVMDLKLSLKTIATRLSAGTELVSRKSQFGENVFVGAGVYGDVIHHAKGQNVLNYVSHNQRETMDLKDSFSSVTPGIMVYAGFQGPLGRIDLRYTLDNQSFSVPGLPIGKQRRTLIGLNFSFR